MDKVKAHILENELKGKQIGAWIIESLIDHGKSAAVFKAQTANNEIVAVKVFDQELIEKYGDATQVARIQREIELKDHRHPHLIQILGGGFDKATNSHFIAMQYLPGKNLKKGINDIPFEDV